MFGMELFDGYRAVYTYESTASQTYGTPQLAKGGFACRHDFFLVRQDSGRFDSHTSPLERWKHAKFIPHLDERLSQSHVEAKRQN